MKKSQWFAVAGFLIGWGAPLGALVLRAVLAPSRLPFFQFVGTEWLQNPFFYWYMLVATCAVITFLGFLLGRNEDIIDAQNRVLARQATHDSLTGLENHRRMHEVFREEFKKHLDLKRPISCLLMDLDFFKKINDTYGHPFGDRVLREFSRLLLQCVRQGDVATRYGGEEFLCILPDCGEKDARVVAERIRQGTEKLVIEKDSAAVKITVSVGVVTARGVLQTDYRTLIEVADKNLYRAKKEGRNRVVQTSSGKR